MSWITTLPMFLILQSNELIAQSVAQHLPMQPDYSHYVGITGSIGAMFLALITMIGGMLHNYGLGIILSCVMVRVMLLPLTRMQIHGMKTMQILQPVMKTIQRYYPDKNDQSAKTMELYSRYKINPVAGCLPMLIQLPIMFGVYRALYDSTFAGQDFLGIQLLFPVSVTSGRSFMGGPDLADLIDITVTQLHLQSFIIRIPDSIPVIGGGFWYWPGLILVALYVASSFLMQRIMRKVNAPHPEFEAEFKAEIKSPDPNQAPDIGQQMQKQMGMFNIMIFLFAFIFSAGALVYFIVQNLLMVLEYTLLPRTMSFAYNAKELKTFIMQPPPPLKTPAGQVPRTKLEPPVAKLKSADAQLDQVSNPEDDDEEALGGAITSSVRPRRKKKKR